jgi:thiosulfate/3-mercaptopyruvate sulfurtransferase
LPDTEVFAARMAALGVNSQTQVVAYDGQGGVYASRLWWMLRWIGHDKVAVLDGGIGAWQKAGFALDTEVPALTAGELHLRHSSYPAPVDATAVMSNIQNKQFQLVDARNADRFAGRNETIDPVAGHIPGASNRFFQNNLDPATGCFKSAEILHAEFSAFLGTTKAGEVVHQCGSGVTACHNLLAMEIAGLSGSRLYPGSWSEWCSDSSRPVAVASPSTP